MLITESKLNRDRHFELSVPIPCAHGYAPNVFHTIRIATEGHSARCRPLALYRQRLAATRSPSEREVLWRSITARASRFAECHARRVVDGVEG